MVVDQTASCVQSYFELCCSKENERTVSLSIPKQVAKHGMLVIKG